MPKTIELQRRDARWSAGGRLVECADVPGSRANAVVKLGGVERVALMLTPTQPGTLAEQVGELVAATRELLRRHEWPMALTTQTVFLRDPADQSGCEAVFARSPIHRNAINHFVAEPPCSGARIAIEAWAVGGPGVRVARFSPNCLRVEYDGIHWVHTAGVAAGDEAGVCAASRDVFQQTGRLLTGAGAGWEHVVRTWWYLGGITAPDGDGQRYHELNRARTEGFARLQFGSGHLCIPRHQAAFPASTGIGTERSTGLSLATLALQTTRNDVSLLPLENPLQTPAYDYAACYSPKSPKFSRAMALVTPEYVTTWISGTASIVHSEVVYPASVIAQTEQTLDNIAALISRENYGNHGVANTGAALADLAKVRVYVKRAKDFAACRSVVQRRLGNIPAIYVVADICRPDLLVEIEGVAFSRRQTEFLER